MELDARFVLELLEVSRGRREPRRLGDGMGSLFPTARLYPDLHYWPGLKGEGGAPNGERWSIEIKVRGCLVVGPRSWDSLTFV